MKSYYTIIIALYIVSITYGQGWQWANPLPTGNTLNSVYFTDENIGYAVGNLGTIIKTTNGGGYYVNINVPESNTKSISIHPNPVSAIITVETPAKGHLSILDINGHVLIKEQITKTNTRIDIDRLPAGVYFVKVIGENGVQFGKLVKQ